MKLSSSGNFSNSTSFNQRFQLSRAPAHHSCISSFGDGELGETLIKIRRQKIAELRSRMTSKFGRVIFLLPLERRMSCVEILNQGPRDIQSVLPLACSLTIEEKLSLSRNGIPYLSHVPHSLFPSPFFTFYFLLP